MTRALIPTAHPTMPNAKESPSDKYTGRGLCWWVISWKITEKIDNASESRKDLLYRCCKVRPKEPQRGPPKHTRGSTWRVRVGGQTDVRPWMTYGLQKGTGKYRKPAEKLAGQDREISKLRTAFQQNSPILCELWRWLHELLSVLSKSQFPAVQASI